MVTLTTCLGQVTDRAPVKNADSKGYLTYYSTQVRTSAEQSTSCMTSLSEAIEGQHNTQFVWLLQFMKKKVIRCAILVSHILYSTRNMYVLT
jgi:hypothetical protein